MLSHCLTLYAGDDCGVSAEETLDVHMLDQLHLLCRECWGIQKNTMSLRVDPMKTTLFSGTAAVCPPILTGCARSIQEGAPSECVESSLEVCKLQHTGYLRAVCWEMSATRKKKGSKKKKGQRRYFEVRVSDDMLQQSELDLELCGSRQHMSPSQCNCSKPHSDAERNVWNAINVIQRNTQRQRVTNECVH